MSTYYQDFHVTNPISTGDGSCLKSVGHVHYRKRPDKLANLDPKIELE